MPKERIGILGGTFDPIHLGHLSMAEAAIRTGALDRLIILPSGNPPHKHDITPAEDRWRMVCAAVANNPKLDPSRIEIDREGVIYTVDTLREMSRLYPKADFFYLIGTDTLFELKKWHESEAVLQMCTFMVCPRPWNSKFSELAEERKRLIALGARFIDVDMETVEISSTDIREAIRVAGPTPELPVVCREYAQLAGLYGCQGRLPEASVWLPKLFAALSYKRFSHSLAVAHTARQLAKRHEIDPIMAERAAILHDCAKCLPLKEMKRICQENKLTDDPLILESGALMHSIAGARIAEQEYGEHNPEILEAIACHTTGKPGMTKLDMIVYLADKIEPTRENYPTLEKVRMLAQLSLEKAMICSIEGTENHVKKGGKPMHPQSIDTLKWLKQQNKATGTDGGDHAGTDGRTGDRTNA